MSARDVEERRPRREAKGWHTSGEERLLPTYGEDSTLAIRVWRRGGLLVISTLELAEAPRDETRTIPTWHISVTENGERPSAHGLAKALRAFGMEGAEEDNHHPGKARNFWLAVDPAERVTCQCKETEDVRREPGGYEWTNPKEELDCRGCELELITGAKCPIHVATAATQERS